MTTKGLSRDVPDFSRAGKKTLDAAQPNEDHSEVKMCEEPQIWSF